ncbi:VOC family protein [Pseudomonas asiatica]|uniref:VOC family protein n=1 Tax=Pseudomonas asiatica TaxID=2219225 RepID=UPI0018AA1E32|nr:VOC family protein [Pseudomonas asiatica]MBF8803513.1 VOC family protein [Pseudomonas asiatica]
MVSKSPTPDGKIFLPRRLAHANIFVSDYEKACNYYHYILGFVEAYRQPDNLASFLSNGNTYHDFALVDVKSRYSKPGQRPGLNHMAFEVDSEAELVAAYNRGLESGVKYLGAANHDVAYSIYLKDPDGNEVEFYADVVEDWSEFRRGTIIKKKPEWIPGVTNTPDARHLYNPNPKMKMVDGAVTRGKRVTHMGIVARDYPAMYHFYTTVCGLTPVYGGLDKNYVLLAGTASSGDIALYKDGPQPGMHQIGIEVWSESDLDAVLAQQAGQQPKVIKHIDHPARRVVCVEDMDGLVIQLYVNRDWNPAQLENIKEEDLIYFL